MLRTKALRAGYANQSVLDDIDIEVASGEIVALIGANGAGKSTLAKTIMGVIPNMSGEIWFDGARIEALGSGQRILRGLVLVPEGRQIFAGLTVEENLFLGGRARRHREREIRASIEEVAQLFPVLHERMREPGGNLSGGQQQMLAIARGLVGRPKLLILDEPSLGLSPILVKQIFTMISQLRERGLAILLSEQNAIQTLAIADRAYVVENGRIAMSGTGPDLAARDEVAQKYLGASVDSQGIDDQQRRTLADRITRALA